MKKILSILMATLMIASLGVVSFNAADTDITNSGGNGTTRVELTYGDVDENGDLVSDKGANFRVTVPTVLPFSVDADGNVTVADNAKIINLSNGQVKVTKATANTVNGWEIVATDTDFKKVPVNSKKFKMELNGDKFGAGTSVDLTLGSAWTIINGKDEMALPYDGDFAVQSAALKDGHIANIVFTVAWNTI